MKELTNNQQRKLKLLETSLGVQGEGGEILAAGSNPALCASLKREELLQFQFMFIYQIIVLILTLAVLGLLLLAAWRVADGQAFQGIIAGAGAIISGAAARFVLKRLKDAQDTHAAAQVGFEKHHCEL